jgi:hypothetical protein
MYYEEQMFNGVLCWRGTPDGVWKEVPPEMLTTHIQLKARAAELEADKRCMVEKAADKSLDGYRELVGARCTELEQMLETSRAGLSSLKAVALAQNSEWQAMANEWDRFWTAVGVCLADITVDQAIEKWQALERQAEHLRRENDRLRAAAGNCGGEPMVERRAQAHEGEEANR